MEITRSITYFRKGSVIHKNYIGASIFFFQFKLFYTIKILLIRMRKGLCCLYCSFEVEQRKEQRTEWGSKDKKNPEKPGKKNELISVQSEHINWMSKIAIFLSQRYLVAHWANLNSGPCIVIKEGEQCECSEARVFVIVVTWRSVTGSSLTRWNLQSSFVK